MSNPDTPVSHEGPITYEPPRIESVQTLTSEEATEMHARMTGQTLLDSADGHMWAEEFCRIFSGKVVNGDTVDVGLMIGWFANAIEVGKSFGVKNLQIDGPYWSFLNMYHQDKANACMHCAPVRFSPITFRLAEFLCETVPTLILESPELAEVVDAKGKYEEDPGR